MSLNKAIKYGKENREEYKRSARFDRTCRNHGSCSYCSINRQINKTRAIMFAKMDLKEYT